MSGGMTWYCTCRQRVACQGIQLCHELVEAVQLMLQSRLEGLPNRAAAVLFLSMALQLPACRYSVTFLLPAPDPHQ